MISRDPKKIISKAVVSTIHTRLEHIASEEKVIGEEPFSDILEFLEKLGNNKLPFSWEFGNESDLEKININLRQKLKAILDNENREDYRYKKSTSEAIFVILLVSAKFFPLNILNEEGSLDCPIDYSSIKEGEAILTSEGYQYNPDGIRGSVSRQSVSPITRERYSQRELDYLLLNTDESINSINPLNRFKQILKSERGRELLNEALSTSGELLFSIVVISIAIPLSLSTSPVWVPATAIVFLLVTSYIAIRSLLKLATLKKQIAHVTTDQSLLDVRKLKLNLKSVLDDIEKEKLNAENIRSATVPEEKYSPIPLISPRNSISFSGTPSLFAHTKSSSSPVLEEKERPRATAANSGG